MYLLIDAGGTSTKAFLHDGGGIISQYRGPPGSVATVGLERSVESIEEVIRHYGGRRFDAIAIALAGTDVQENLRKARTVLRSRLRKYAPKINVEHDAHVVLLSNADMGCSAILGTGSIVYCFDGKRRVIRGDRGWLVGDPCSGFYFGREYLRAILYQFQGMKRRSCMLLNSGFRNEDELVKFLYENSCNQDKIAAFSSKLFSCIDKDEQAKYILYKGLNQEWEAIKSALKSSGQNSLYYFGGLLASATFESSFVDFITKKAREYRIDVKIKKSNEIIDGLLRLLQF